MAVELRTSQCHTSAVKSEESQLLAWDIKNGWHKKRVLIYLSPLSTSNGRLKNLHFSSHFFCCENFDLWVTFLKNANFSEEESQEERNSDRQRENNWEWSVCIMGK